jgi:hypothetical protein
MVTVLLFRPFASLKCGKSNTITRPPMHSEISVGGAMGILAKMGNLQLSPGSLFANRFEIQRTAGSGGMGTVYRGPCPKILRRKNSRNGR